MQQLFSPAHIDAAEIKSILDNLGVTELLNLSDPCYLPRHKEYYSKLLDACGLNQKNIEDFAERTWQGRKEKDWKNVADPTNLFFIWLMRYFLNRRDLQTFKLALTSHMVRQYSNLRIKFLKYCDPDVFQYTLENLTKTHLFVREKKIPGAITYLSKELEKKFAKKIKKWDLDGIKDFITESRGRLNQSLRSFANSYYKNKEKGKGYGFSIEQGEEEENLDALDRVNILIAGAIKEIFRGPIDQLTVEKFSKFTKVSKSMAKGLVETLSNKDAAEEYRAEVRSILELFIGNSASINAACGAAYLKNIATLMQVKRTTKPVYFKKQVQELLSKLIKKAGYEKRFSELKKQTQSRFSQFLAYYITSVMRNLLPPKKTN